MISPDPSTPLEIISQQYRDSNHLDIHDWWVVYPDWLRGETERIKGMWFRLAGHPLGGLRGFEFWGGPRWTYDQATDEWSEDDLS